MSTELRFLLAIILMIGVLVVTNLLFPPVTPAPSRAVDAETATGPGLSPGVAEESPPRTTRPSPTEPAAVDTVPAQPYQSEQEVVVEGPLYRHVFTTRGARLLSAELLDFRSFTRDGPVQLIPEGPTGALGLRLILASDTLDLRSVSFNPSDDHVTVGAGGPKELTFRHEGRGLVVEIRYSFSPDSYLVDVVGSIRGVDRALLLIDLGSGLPFNEADEKSEERALAYVGNHLQEGITSHPLREGVARPTVHEGPFLWAAFKSKYFVFALLPGVGEVGPEHFGGLLLWPEGEYRAPAAVTETIAGDGTFAYRAFIGPQDYENLTALGSDLEEVNPYGWRLFRPVIRPFVVFFTVVLVFVHNTLNLAYGWVLVLFGITMRIVLWPFNQKAMRAQMRNMAVQPLLKEIQTKYKDNPERLQKEMMRLYKEHGFNPMAGCLPMLLPWPLLIALFFVFQNTIEFRGVPFLWIPDLSAPDPIFILPLFLGVSMFFLQWISMRSMPEVNPQMKMMLWIMPIMMVFIFFNLAAGLNLYYSVFNMASVPQQYLVAKERERLVAQGPVKPRAS